MSQKIMVSFAAKVRVGPRPAALAADRGFVDAIIQQRETHKKLI